MKSESFKDLELDEREEHDKLYEKSLPFDFKSYKIDPKHVIWYEDYCYKPGRRRDRGNRTKRLFQILNLNKLKGKKILDVGCGNGQYSVFFALMGATVYGIDITPVGISVAKKISKTNHVEKKCHFSVQNISNTDFPDEFFDIVVFHEVLHHAVKYPNVNEETYRITKKNGIVIIADGLRENPIYNICKLIYQKITLQQQPRGDVDLKKKDIEKFAQNFSNKKAEYFSLLFMMKEVLVEYMNYSIVRKLLYFLKRIDDIILAKYPIFKSWCGEFIVILYK